MNAKEARALSASSARAAAISPGYENIHQRIANAARVGDNSCRWTGVMTAEIIEQLVTKDKYKVSVRLGKNGTVSVQDMTPEQAGKTYVHIIMW